MFNMRSKLHIVDFVPYEQLHVDAIYPHQPLWTYMYRYHWQVGTGYTKSWSSTRSTPGLHLDHLVVSSRTNPLDHRGTGKSMPTCTCVYMYVTIMLSKGQLYCVHNVLIYIWSLIYGTIFHLVPSETAKGPNMPHAIGVGWLSAWDCCKVQASQEGREFESCRRHEMKFSQDFQINQGHSRLMYGSAYTCMTHFS